MNKDPAIILDPGSGSIKFGISYFDESCEQKIYQNMSIPSIYGTSRYASSLFRKRPKNQGAYKRDYVIGKHALMLFDLLNITFPVRRGIVNNWDIVLRILHDGLESFQKTVAIPDSILVSEPWFQPRKKREEMVEMIFEKYNYSRFFSVPQVVLTLFNYNQKTGYVIESGAEQTQFAHIFNGHKIQHECLNFNKGGFDVSIEIPKDDKIDPNHFLRNLVEDQLFNETKSQDAAKTPLNKVRLNPYQHFYEIENIKRNPPENFKKTLSDLYGKVFFNEPNETGQHNNNPNLLDEIDKITKKNDNLELYFGGGNFACEDFRNQIENQLKQKGFRIHTLPDDEFEWSVWKGGNKFVNLQSMNDFWIPIKDYYEVGTSVIDFSCL